MHYLGSKSRHAGEITAITQAARKPGQTYVEPFVGGGNIINKVPANLGPRIANDLNEPMVALLDCLGNKGWSPPETMTQKRWREISKWKVSDCTWEDKALYAFAATGPTFGSLWFGKWVDDNRYRQGRESALRDAPGLAGVQFHYGQFDALQFPDESIVYCDPPYSGTTGYEGAKITIKVDDANATNNWKTSKFWRWADNLVEQRGCTVFVSEYSGPKAGDVYDHIKGTPEQLAEIARLNAEGRDLQRRMASDNTITGATLDPIRYQIAALVAQAGSERERLAARWQLAWSKDVAVNIAAGAVEEAGGAERKTECLFMRAP